jgi:tRNA threonylcarbamoyladenosine biosynthesis protein TsaE
VIHAGTEAETRRAGAELVGRLRIGDVVFLEGPLGAGKTTFVRGLLEALGHAEPVRSPTFNLIQAFETVPPIMHADLYRVKTHHGIGLEEYLDTHVCLIEWPDRATGLAAEGAAWVVRIEFEGEGRAIEIVPPKL